MTIVKYLKNVLLIKHLIDTCVSVLSENVEVNMDFHLLFVIIVKIDIEKFYVHVTVHRDKCL